MIRLLQIPMLGVMVAICAIHAKRFADNKAIGLWFHFIWGCVYFIPATFLAWQMSSYWLAGAFVIERFVFYNPILNRMRGKAFFYLSVNSQTPSWWDSIEIGWRNAYPYVWIFSCVAFMIIQVIL